MGRKKIKISKSLLKRLYVRERLSPYKIGPIFGANFATISNRLKEYNIPLRTRAQAQIKYPRRGFSENSLEAAYLVGFRLGDLNVYIPSAKNSETIVARCHTTDFVQVQLMQRLFKQYGHLQISKNKNNYNVSCYLNVSFMFLVPKKDELEDWIKKDYRASAAFLAGYIDAEGNFIINQGRARFKIDSYDYGILSWAHDWLSSLGINVKFRKLAEEGSSKWNVKKFNKDLWRLNINDAHSLKKFIDILTPYFKHKRRLAHARLMLNNIQYRIDNATV